MTTILAATSHTVAAEGKVFDIRRFGATGDGRTLDTAAVNKAVEACAAAGGGRVVFPPGKYLSGTGRWSLPTGQTTSASPAGGRSTATRSSILTARNGCEARTRCCWATAAT